MGAFTLKLKTKEGQYILNDFNESSTISELLKAISRLTNYMENELSILIGFPPKPLTINDPTLSLSQYGIRNSDTIIVEKEKNPNRNVVAAAIVEKKTTTTTIASSLPSSSSSSPSSSSSSSLLSSPSPPLLSSLQPASSSSSNTQQQQQQLLKDNINSIATSSSSSSSSTIQQNKKNTGGSGIGSGWNGDGDDEITTNTNGILLKQVVPSDNSCLFTSIGFVLAGKIDTNCAPGMREIIASTVKNNQYSYDEAMLGKPNREYCEWIAKSESWGGAIEVSILSNYYGIEIDVVDIQNANINRFGEDKQYSVRAFILFDGIHYDALYLEPFEGTTIRTLFQINDENVYQQAKQIADESKSSRQFTDVNKFKLRCIQCDTMLSGQAAAQSHCKTTGHINFGEI